MNIRSALKTFFNSARQSWVNFFKSQHKQSSGKGFINVDMKLYNAQGTIAAIQETFNINNVAAAIGDDIGRRGVELVQEALEPISRSGKTKDSFKYRYNPATSTVEIYSDEESAYAIQHGFSESGSIQSLMDWMQYKSEFSGLDSKAKKRVAFAIHNRIENDGRAGGKSTIWNLPPYGKRQYQYLEVALKKLEPEIETVLKDFKL